jgi:hypothetical protein
MAIQSSVVVHHTMKTLNATRGKALSHLGLH